MAASRTKESGEMAGAREEEPLVADASCVDAKGKERERRVNRDRDRERDRDGGTSDNVKVSVRCRPMVEKEQREGHRGVVRVDRLRREVTVQLPSPAQQRVFTYDVVFGPESTQAEVFNETARPIVDSVLQGYNGTIFAYGQTGTGKTHTMVGNKESAGMRGIIPNSFAHIFGHIAQSEGEVRFLVRVSYLEIYNEEVRDLLGKNHQARLEVRERPDIGVYVKDLSSFVVKGPEDMEKLMSIGNRNRAFGATDMNEYSSRSHTIFTITVECGEIGPDHKQHIRMGKLHLVDLAGSERQSKTHATGDRQKEAIKINLSLSTLGNVISALVDGKSTHIPYRNSNLTRLLQDSLGGNSKTVMIANVGPADYNCDETLNTLRYANRAKSIQNKAHINQDPKDAMLKEFQKEIDELRKKLAEASESEGSNSDGCEFEEEGGGRNGRKAQNKSKRIMSPRAMASMQERLAAERSSLMAKKNLMESERNQAQKELEHREGELEKAKNQHLELEKKLEDLQSKLIVGGVNLLEKAEEQQKLLEQSARDLKVRRKKEASLRQRLQKQEAEHLNMEERYASLQEEAAAKTVQLKAVWKQFQAAKEETADLRSEFQRENEDLLAAVRELSKELKLQVFIIDTHIPKEYQELLQSHAVWDEATGEWHVRGIAYAGNNMRKQPSPELQEEPNILEDTERAYLTYHLSQQLPPSSVPMGTTGATRGAHREKPSTGAGRRRNV